MPRLETAATVTKELQLAPQIRRKLLQEFRLYGALKTQLDAIKSAMDKHKGVIAALRDETGEMSLSLEGFSTTLVAPIRKKFNPKRFVSDGGDLAIYNAAMEDVPVRPYEKITVAGEKDGDSE